MQLKKYIRYTAIALVAMLPLAVAMLGAEYHGTVKFNNLPMPGATVTATQGDKKLSAVSDENGVFSFPDLPDGTWSLQVDALGFTTIKQDVAPGGGLPGPAFEMKMLPIDQIDTVAQQAPTVTATPGAGATTTTAPAPTTTSSTAPAAPATPSIVAANSAPATGKNGKNAAPPKQATAFQRTDLTGTSNAPAPAEPAPEVSNDLSSRAADANLINGSAQNGASSPFAQNPAFGNNRRGGPRLYNYSLFVNESNSALNAAPFSQNGAPTLKPPTNQFNGGFNFGGPIKIPHLVSQRDNVQFTLNYQRIENRTENVQTTLMPDAAERAGDFSSATYDNKPVQIFDPNTNQPFAGNIIPASRISAQAKALLALYPQPNFSNSTQNYQVPLITNTHTDNYSARVNKSFKRKNFLSGQFGASDTRGDNTSVFNFLDLNRSLGMQATATYRRTYTPRFYGTFTYQFSRQASRTNPFFANVSNISGAAGITGNNQEALNWGPPNLGFSESGIAGLGDANNSVRKNQTNAYGYVGTWNHGRHNITFGGDFRWQQFNVISQTQPRGAFTFNGNATQEVTTVAGVTTAVPGTGYDFADYLLGTPDQSSISYGNADKYLRAKTADLYFTDDWKITPGLSLTLGMRWEYTSPITELYNRLVNLDVAPGFTNVSPVLATSPVGPLTNFNYPRSLVRPDYREFEPRPGFAWRPFPASSMVIRGGYGLAYNTGVYNSFANQMDSQSPFSKSLQAVNSAATPLTLANGFYSAPNVVTNTFALDPNFKIGSSQVWTLSVQRDLPGALVMLATYRGTKGTHLLQSFVPNTFAPGTTAQCSVCGFTYFTSGGNSTREEGQMQLRRRLHNGFTATINYTYSKSIDDVGSFGGGNLGSPAQNWLNLAGERGPSSFDQRHNAQITLQYTSGMGIGGGTLLGGWRGKVMKDWTFLDNINLGTGLPLTPVFAGLLGTNNEQFRASFTGQDPYAAPAGYNLNPKAFTQPAAGQFGNAGMGSLRGPAQFSMNASMQRSFRLNDRFTLSAQLNANNPLNHVVFGSYYTTITSPTFGLPYNANAMRSMTAVMRLQF